MFVSTIKNNKIMAEVLINNKRGNEVTESINFVLEECCACGIPFFIPKYHQIRLIKTHESFFCPNGHSQSYTGRSQEQIRIDELQQQLSSVKTDRQQIENRLLDEILEKKRLKRQLNRVHKGVCPCCNRTFMNLQKHMETKHPEAKS